MDGVGFRIQRVALQVEARAWGEVGVRQQRCQAGDLVAAQIQGPELGQVLQPRNINDGVVADPLVVAQKQLSQLAQARQRADIRHSGVHQFQPPQVA